MVPAALAGRRLLQHRAPVALATAVLGIILVLEHYLLVTVVMVAPAQMEPLEQYTAAEAEALVL